MNAVDYLWAVSIHYKMPGDRTIMWVSYQFAPDKDTAYAQAKVEVAKANPKMERFNAECCKLIPNEEILKFAKMISSSVPLEPEETTRTVQRGGKS